MQRKLKSFLADDTLFYVILIVLVGVISFGLGRKSVVEGGEGPAPTAPAGIIFTESPEYGLKKEQNEESEEIIVVGSRSGTKYHLLDCPGASQMKEDNKVFFESTALAEAAGYTPAANCPGLQ